MMKAYLRGAAFLAVGLLGALHAKAGGGSEPVVALTDIMPLAGQVAFMDRSSGCEFIGSLSFNGATQEWVVSIIDQICGNIRTPMFGSVVPVRRHSTGPLVRAGEELLLVRSPR